MLGLVAIVVTLAAIFGLMSSRWLRLPTAIGTMLLALLLSAGLALTANAFPTVHQWAVHSLLQIDYERLILHGLLSLLLFAGAFLLDLKYLAHEKFAVGILAGLGTLLSAAIVGAGMYFAAPLLGFHPPLLQSLLFGALISPTDPIAVLEMLRRVAAPHYLQAQLAGESLFNDGVGAVLFLTLLGIAESNHLPSIGHVTWVLLLDTGGGLLLGIVLALIVSRLMCVICVYQIDLLLTLSLALGGYALADHLHLSAPLEAVAAGLALRWSNSRHPANISHNEIEHFWTAIDEIQNSVLFVLMGCEFLAVPLDRAAFLVGALAIGLVNAARFLVTASLLPLIRFVQRGHRSYLSVLVWGGLRGGLSIALALSVPERLGRNWILASTYIVVVFSILIQGGTMDLFLKRFRPAE